MRKIALDVGDVRIGIATSDIMGIIAGGYETYVRKDYQSDLKYIAEFVKNNQGDTLVFGLPINMDGTEGPRAQGVRQMAEDIRAYTDVKIVFQDERLTTVSAEKMLIQGNVRRDKRKKVIDKVAATIILQSYLDRLF